MVMGFEIQTRTTETTKLALSQIAKAVAGIIWKGTGTKAMNKPIANPRDVDFRFKCQRLGSCSMVPNICKCL